MFAIWFVLYFSHQAGGLFAFNFGPRTWGMRYEQSV